MKRLAKWTMVAAVLGVLWLTRHVVVLLVLFTLMAFGCTGCAGAPAPPATIAIDSNLPQGVQAAAAEARDAWCAAPVGWCPEIVAGRGEAFVTAGHWSKETNGVDPGSIASNRGNGTILLSETLLSAGYVDAEYWVGALTHELGHFGIDGHVASSPLMRANMETPREIPSTVDPPAAAEWCNEQGC